MTTTAATCSCARGPAAFEAYLAGLRDAGWQGDPALARLGYTAWAALWFGVTPPMALKMWTSEDMRALAAQLFGRSAEEQAAGWSLVCEFGLDRADEARQLMDHLHLA